MKPSRRQRLAIQSGREAAAFGEAMGRRAEALEPLLDPGEASPTMEPPHAIARRLVALWRQRVEGEIEVHRLSERAVAMLTDDVAEAIRNERTTRTGR